MAEQALSTIGVIFGWGLGTLTTAPTEWKEIEDCISISGVEVTKERLDATPMKVKRRRYIGGHEDTGGELTTTFNNHDTFDAQWAEMLNAYDNREDGQSMWFCAYHPSKKNMVVYVVEPGSLPAPEFGVGVVLQYSITNTLVDLPEPIPAVKPIEVNGATETGLDEE